MPDRDAVSPPQLPGDAPVVHVVDPAEPAWLKARGVDHRVAVAPRVPRRPGQRVDLHPPLQRESGLDRLAAAFGMPDAVHVGPLLGHDAALLGKCAPELYTGLESVHAVENRSGVSD